MKPRWLILFLLCTLSSFAQDNDFTYTNNNGTIIITGYAGPGGEVAIPDFMTGFPVTFIAVKSFSGCTNLTSVRIPNRVRSIGPQAFAGCTNLDAITVASRNSFYASVDGILFNKERTTLIKYPARKSGSDYTIPNGVNSIGEYAFNSCTYLTTVTIPASVTNIKASAFGLSTNLSAITVDELNACYSSVAGVLFNKSQTRLIQCPAGKTGNYTIPNSVTSIGEDAFFFCTRLSNVTIPNRVVGFGGNAFAHCTNLTNIIIPNSVTNIGAWAFSRCTGLTNVTIGDSVTSIENRAFPFCTSLTNVIIPHSVTNIGAWAFDGCTNLTGVYFKGDAPNSSQNVFDDASKATVYYLSGTKGWEKTFSGRPTVVWRPWSVSKGLKGFDQ